VQLVAGDNIIKVFNDDSWQVMKGIADYEHEGNPNWYQDKPGDIPLKNFAPNFDKFVFTPAAIDQPIELDAVYNVNVKFTKGGIAVANKNSVAQGEAVTFTINPVLEIEDVRINGESRLSDIVDNEDGTYSLTVSNVQGEITGEALFREVPKDTQAENNSLFIRNNSFG